MQPAKAALDSFLLLSRPPSLLLSIPRTAARAKAELSAAESQKISLPIPTLRLKQPASSSHLPVVPGSLASHFLAAISVTLSCSSVCGAIPYPAVQSCPVTGRAPLWMQLTPLVHSYPPNNPELETGRPLSTDKRWIAVDS